MCLDSAKRPHLTSCSFSVPRGKVELSCPQNFISFSRSLQRCIPVLPPGEAGTWCFVWRGLHRIPFFSKPRVLMGLQGKVQVEKRQMVLLLCWYHFSVCLSLPCLPQGKAQFLAGPQGTCHTSHCHSGSISVTCVLPAQTQGAPPSSNHFQRPRKHSTVECQAALAMAVQRDQDTTRKWGKSCPVGFT